VKRLYQKPEVKRVKLVPNESVLQGCKYYWLNGPGGLDCLQAGARPPCSSPEAS
jgi:hypothetical protein